MDKHIALSPCPFCGAGLTLDIDEDGGVAILHSLKGEKNCWFPSIVEIEMPVGTMLEEMAEIINRRPTQESYEHALVGASLVAAARLQDKVFEIQDLKAELARCDEKIAELRNDITGYRRTVVSQNEIIARLKEDAERLASGYEQVSREAVPYCVVCKKDAFSGYLGQIKHDDWCPITLHRALMKELE